MADVRNNDRQRRLAAALRENLKRRKAQLRGRADQQDAPEGPDDGTQDEASASQVEAEKPA